MQVCLVGILESITLDCCFLCACWRTLVGSDFPAHSHSHANDFPLNVVLKLATNFAHERINRRTIYSTYVRGYVSRGSLVGWHSRVQVLQLQLPGLITLNAI